MKTLHYTLEIPVRFLLNIEAPTLEQAWKIAQKMTLDDAFKRHRGYVVGDAWRIVEREEGNGRDDSQEGGEA